MSIQALESPEWLDATGARPGVCVPVPLDLTEMNVPASSRAKVLSVGPCPPVEHGPGRVVTLTVNHLNCHVYNLCLTWPDGRRETLGVTAPHRFYSEDRGAWVAAANLRPGERLRPVVGEAAGPVVASATPRPGVSRVYNMTVEAEHMYYVGATGVLTHNNYGDMGGLDQTGKWHGNVPNKDSLKGLEPEELEQIADELRSSIAQRNYVNGELGADPGHTSRVLEEIQALRAIEKMLK